MTLHEMLDVHYHGDDEFARALEEGGVDLAAREGPLGETLLHVAARRRRLGAIRLLLDRGAPIDAVNACGKTAWAHAARRSFHEIAEELERRGASTDLTPADRLAIAIVEGRLDEARALLAEHPQAARTGNPDEDRLLADAAGRPAPEAVALLIEAGADLTATGLDSGTPLHQAAWFGQPVCARLLLDAGAPLEWFDATHHSSPLGWAVHGSRYADAGDRQDAYVAIVRMLLAAGARLHYPDDPDGDAYRDRLLRDASPAVAEVLKEALAA